MRILLSPFLKWDAVHYLNIAIDGYRRDYQLVFFPLYPNVIGFLSRLLVRALDLLDNPWSITVLDATMMTAVALNMCCFVSSSFILKKMLSGLHLTEPIADIALLLFIFNPAGIFFTTVYTEACFSLFSWWGMYSYINGRHLSSCLCFSIASMIRSNGSLHVVLVLTLWAANELTICASKDITASSPTSIGLRRVSQMMLFARRAALVLMNVIAILSPILLWNYYIHYLLCVNRSHISIANSNHNNSINNIGTNDDDDDSTAYASPTDIFCSSRSFPLGYSYLQERYWGVGFLRYYQWKQAPNFLLALPITYFASRTIVSQCYALYEQVRYSSSGGGGGVYEEDDDDRCKVSIDMTARNVAVAMTMHLLGTLAVGLLWANVQITTRLICSSCPIIYVGMASIVTGYVDKSSRDARTTARGGGGSASSSSSLSAFLSVDGYTVAWYILVYNIAGVLLHTNYYPWT
jgi:phosphatidylinositol glycan class V